MESNKPQYMCKNCNMNIKAGKTPKIALCRGLNFPEIPFPLLNLTTVEQRLISPRYEFMNIRSLGRERQHGLHGMIVNVPIDVEKTVNKLPRTFEQSQTIQLQLFRKMSYKKPYLYETIRPQNVLAAARYLLSTQLFREEGIELSENWTHDIGVSGEEVADFIVNPCDRPEDLIVDTGNNNIHHDGIKVEQPNETETILNEIDDLLQELDQWDETKIDLPINPGALDTLLLPTENILLKLAPGEGSKPLILTLDKYVEELAYPCVFGGEKRHIPEDISLAKRAKSDIMR